MVLDWSLARYEIFYMKYFHSTIFFHPQVMPGKPAVFTVDSSRTGPAPLSVEVESDTGRVSSRQPSVAETGPGQHEVTYVPPPVGNPYQVSCNPNPNNPTPTRSVLNLSINSIVVVNQAHIEYQPHAPPTPNE